MSIYKKKNTSEQLSFVHNRKVKNYCLELPFDPPKIYHELPFVGRTTKGNMIYPMVRDLLIKLGLDKQNISSAKWNPFKDIVKPGQNVIVKPNLVTHRHYYGENALFSTISHASILRPLIDYLYLAMEGRGSIVIADNPVEGADFGELMKFTGIAEMVNELVKRGYSELKVLDLRPRVSKEAANGAFYYEDQPGDPLGYVTIDLGKDSLFSEFDHKTKMHYYTLADKTVDHVDPKYIGKSKTDEYHNSSSHRYIVSKSILNADTIINVAKMKSHCKAGVSLTLKNMIGIVYEKDCMPHHRPGLPPDGDSFPAYPASHYIVAKKSYLNLKRLLHIHKIPGVQAFRDLLQKKKILVGQQIEHGNWRGNDTIWRTILDLNRIALYADKEGRMRDEPQRNYFAFIDGIISQQGEGPMGGDPVPTSILIGGFNPVLADALAIKAMGLDCRLFKSVSRAGGIEKWGLLPSDGYDLSFAGVEVPDLKFKLSKGWR